MNYVQMLNEQLNNFTQIYGFPIGPNVLDKLRHVRCSGTDEDLLQEAGTDCTTVFSQWKGGLKHWWMFSDLKQLDFLLSFKDESFKGIWSAAAAALA